MDNIYLAIKNAGGTALQVGGCVRDRFIGVKNPPKDIDIEVYGLEPQKLEALLKKLFDKVDFVGQSFGTYKCGEYDIAIPRKELKTGEGHKGFEVECDPFMSPKEAARRRDFTINAISYDPIKAKVIDPFGGVNDIQHRVLRATSTAFSEDPLRVLRGFQFISRFNLICEMETLVACRKLAPKITELAPERVFQEFLKWANGAHPGNALEFLYSSWWLCSFSCLGNMVHCPQDSEYHPEGDVWEHTKHVCEAATKTEGYKTNPELVMMAALLHDVGKPGTTILKNGRWASPGHAEVGGLISKVFLDGLKAPKTFNRKVCELVRNHMYHLGDNTPRKARRLLRKRNKYDTVDLLWSVIEADHSGRPPLEKGFPAQELRDLVEKEQGNLVRKENGQIEYLVKGSDLLAAGYAQGPDLGKKLEELHSLQIDKGLSREELLERI